MQKTSNTISTSRYLTNKLKGERVLRDRQDLASLLVVSCLYMQQAVLSGACHLDTVVITRIRFFPIRHAISCITATQVSVVVVGPSVSVQCKTSIM